MKSSRLLLCAALLLIAAGCQFVELSQDLDKLARLSSIEGTVISEHPSDNPITVALFSDALKRENLVNAQLIDGHEFRLDAPPGAYFVFAFEDKNRDFDYQPDEPAGYFGEPTAILLQEGADQSGIRIELRGKLDLPGSADSRARPQATDSEKYPKLWVGRKNIGALASLDDSRFDTSVAKMGLWQPVRFSLEHGPGLFLLQPYHPDKIPVLFVHGIGDTPRRWQAIIDSLDTARFQPWIFHYASGLPLQTNARYLFDAVTQLRLQHGIETMHLVAHSMGGLVSQAFINRHQAGAANYLRLFVTLATPWDGHAGARRGVAFAPSVVPAWRDIAPGSEFLASLRKTALPWELDYHLIYSTGSSSESRADATDGVVTVASQREFSAWTRAARVYGFPATHTGILSDPEVIKVLDTILEQDR